MAKKTHRSSGSATAAQRRQPSNVQRQQRLEGKPQIQPRNVRRRQTKSYRTWYIVGGALVVIAIIIGSFYVISNQSSAANNPATRGTSDPEVLKSITGVDPALLAQIGTGGQQNPLKHVPGNPSARTGATGKPELLYWGAEFCPYCAAERWPMVIALSRFGTFSKLIETTSSSTDTYPDTATFTFYGSSYKSSYLDFVPLEAEDRNQNALQTPTADQEQFIKSLNPGETFPFVIFANTYYLQGPSYTQDVLSGLSQKDIAIQVSNPTTDISKRIVGTANFLTAGICLTTNNTPASVCQTPVIQQIEQTMPKTAIANSHPANPLRQPETPLALIEDRRFASLHAL